jgi:tetratricopeptide (TPR) repeat protein
MNQVMYGWDWQAARRHITHGLAIAPDNAEILAAAGLLSYTLGRSTESIAYYERALKSDPMNSRLYLDYTRPLNADLRFAEAERACRRALELSPDGVPYHCLLAESLALQGRVDEAIAEASKEKADWARLWGLAVFHHMAGHRAESDLALNTLIEHNADHSAAQIVCIYAVRGDADAAFLWLERGYAQRDSGVTHLKAFWQFQKLRSDPRWDPMLKKLGLDG